MCSSLSSGRTCVTVGNDCGGANDDDDPPCATDVGNLCDVKTASETGSVVCSANLTFFMFGSASEAGRGILSCTFLTRALRSTCEDMAWMIRVLHCSVRSREPMHPGVYPYRASSTEFLTHTRRGVAAFVLNGGEGGVEGERRVRGR